jgi:hypothetical protein
MPCSLILIGIKYASVPNNPFFLLAGQQKFLFLNLAAAAGNNSKIEGRAPSSR